MAPGLTLKQRLTALSNAQSSPSSPSRASSFSASPSAFASRTSFANHTGKRKSLLPFNTPWGRRGAQSHAEGARDGDGGVGEVPDDDYALDRTQDVMSRLIFQAGVDFETRPMVIVNASALPDPKEVSYDVLLSRILAYLDLYVESDYTVVFFTAGGRHTPGWNWVWKAYRSLNRKYRKNLKRLIIVHSTFFSKMLISLAGAIVSPKFFRKIVYIPTLSGLAYHVPLTQIDIPPAVYAENLKHERSIAMPTQTHADLFGVPLEDLMGYDGEKGGVPRVVKDCIQYLRESGMEDEGLFRRSPSSALLHQVQDAYDRGQTVTLSMFNDPHLAAVLLKKYLRDLPEPIFPEALYPVIRACPTPSSDPNDNDMASIAYVRETLLPELAPCVYILLSNVLMIMHEVSLRADSNRMDAHNLALVLCPNLLSGTNPARDVGMCAIPSASTSLASISASMSMGTGAGKEASLSVTEGKTTLGQLVKLCIHRYYEVFDEVRDRSEAVAPEMALGVSASPSNQPGSSAASSLSGEGAFRIGTGGEDEDEEIDDAMLVMPLDSPVGRRRVSGSPARSPTVGSTSIAGPSSNPPKGAGANGSSLPYQPRAKRSGTSSTGVGIANSSSARSMHTTAGRTGPESTFGYNYGYNGGTMTMSKARSLISIGKGSASGAGDGSPSRKGTITVGRGGTASGTGKGKAAGAGVEALSVTASGFFSPPTGAPPVPVLPAANSTASALVLEGGNGDSEAGVAGVGSSPSHSRDLSQVSE